MASLTGYAFMSYSDILDNKSVCPARPVGVRPDDSALVRQVEDCQMFGVGINAHLYLKFDCSKMGDCSLVCPARPVGVRPDDSALVRQVEDCQMFGVGINAHFYLKFDCSKMGDCSLGHW
ncbi:hypothetical protein CBL_09968 [Carabus blaptoides fortunei]